MPHPAKECNITLLSEENVQKYVLPHYELNEAQIERVKFKNTDKQRAVYRVDHLDKTYCLKKVYFSKQELLFVYSAIEWFFRNDINVPRILPNNNRGRFVDFNNMLFILTPWIEGIKCDYDIKEHITSSITNLSLMHVKGKNFVPITGSSLRKNLENFPYSINKHFQQILNCSNLAFKYKDKFSKLFLQHFSINSLLAEISVKASSTMRKENLSLSLCHLDYVNKNIIFDGNNNIWVIDFDKCGIDYCCHDISYFLRRLLRRTNNNWNLDITIECLDLYDNINPLTIDDYKYIFSYLCFPQKYWKLSRDYYNNMSKCNHNSFFYLLKNSLEYDNNQLDFAMKFGKYIENKFKTKII
ncbi:CotS family spore coat protein [Clostridium scatologenes]|uniref:Spore coat protein, CotS family n=1 Tax=Clostridium scatologenes TaxID=1548 RepID=A0A0E3GRN7_CLOSL|nr:CotS family spore coat protein [Clostridium scatologenes]AKA70641.1 spore coat protein, CotS family [Clostridium scatologenes]